MQLDFVSDDIGDHAPLDAKVYAACESDCNKEPPLAGTLLLEVVASASDKMDNKFLNIIIAKQILEEYSQDPGADENSNLKKLLRWCWQRGSFEEIRRLKMLRPMAVHYQADWEKSHRFHSFEKLNAAYNRPFLGNTATDFVNSLLNTGDDIRHDNLTIYARAISILQSSGTGKSRLLTEVGKYTFTLPICLRHPDDPGYPPSDEAVYRYFAQLTTDNDMSFTAHSAIASFLAAAHKTMLEWLQEVQQKNGFDGHQLHGWWYDLMERRVRREGRLNFFSEVLRKANTMRSKQGVHGESPRKPKEKDRPMLYDIVAKSRLFYEEEARGAVEALMLFLTDLHVGSSPICVTYFDEAHELGIQFWILLRLLSHQPLATEMWYVFMGTKSSISYFSPSPRHLLSLRLGNELRKLLLPYIALDFDQNVLQGRREVTAKIGELQSLEHLATYGRPMWKAHLPEEKENEMVQLASWKLINGHIFNDQDTNQVFAVLSQRLCIEPVLVGSEAMALADQSVAHHMRLITGISADRRTFYTYSPSEPILVLGAANILHNTGEVKRLGRVLDTFSKHLCSSGLVEKGLIGELGARVLLLLARDFATPVEGGRGPNLLRPVRLLTMIDVLFGKTTWTGTDIHREAYDNAFGTAHVNFTHWIVTKDPLPEMPDRLLLANLWARGAVLQCCFNQESIDFMMVVYHGDIDADAVFDPAMLSAAFGQVKYKNKADTTAEQAIRPIGLSRELTEPLPYLALLLELGNESHHGTTHSKIKVMIPEAAEKDKFRRLTESHLVAAEALQDYQAQPVKVRTDPKLVKKQKEVKEARVTMDSYNRYTIAVRGVSADVYGILRKANIETEFATLLSTTMPSPTPQDDAIQHMRPIERLGGGSSHNAWMSNYVVRKSEEHSMDVGS